MTNSSVLRSIRYGLNIPDVKLIEIIRSVGGEVSKEEMTSFLKKEDEEGHQECSHEIMAQFLNGLILFKRGRDENKPLQPIQIPITNNIILKKLRVAYELKDSDIVSIIERAGLRVSKAELGAFFRTPEHRNYRECGDQFLRNLLKGLK
jgi:uncharacterized protein YehS (DUF1456 family)